MGLHYVRSLAKMQVISFNYHTIHQDDYQRCDGQTNWPYAPLVIIMPFIQSNKLPDHGIIPTVSLYILRYYSMMYIC